MSKENYECYTKGIICGNTNFREGGQRSGEVPAKIYIKKG